MAAIFHCHYWRLPARMTRQTGKHLLQDERYKDVVIDSFRYLKTANKIKINGYVIMSNHLHVIWQALHGYLLDDIQTSFAKHTSKKFLKLTIAESKSDLYKVNSPDRKHNFWKRNPLGVEVFTPAVFYQKLDYIHYNPVRAGLCDFPEEYKYSSAAFYLSGRDHTGLLEHWAG